MNAAPPISSEMLSMEDLFLFSWDEIPGNDNGRLIEYLNQNFGIDWAKTENIEKIDNDMIIRISNGKNFLSLKLNNEKSQVSLEIDDGKTDKLFVMKEKGKKKKGELNIYKDLYNPDMWLMLAGEDYVLVRVSMHCRFHRPAAYHIQQIVEKYLKAFIVKNYQIGNDGFIIDNDGSKIEFGIHNLEKLLECCQKKNQFFKEPGVKTLIDILYKSKKEDFNKIRYPSKLTIDYSTGEPQILFYIDYFVKKVRDLVNPNINDPIYQLQLGPDVNFNEFNFIAGQPLKDLRKIFFDKNNYFSKQ